MKQEDFITFDVYPKDWKEPLKEIGFLINETLYDKDLWHFIYEGDFYRIRFLNSDAAREKFTKLLWIRGVKNNSWIDQDGDYGWSSESQIVLDNLDSFAHIFHHYSKLALSIDSSPDEASKQFLKMKEIADRILHIFLINFTDSNAIDTYKYMGLALNMDKSTWESILISLIANGRSIYTGYYNTVMEYTKSGKK